MHRTNRAAPDKMQFDIVEMTPEDFDELMEIEELSFPTPWSKTLFVREHHSPLSKIFLAKSQHSAGRKVLGYICLWYICDEVHILNLACHPGYRRSGVASDLLEYCLGFSFDHGAEKAFLEVRESNQVARTLYSKCGFQAVGVRRGYYTDTHEDAIVMYLEMKPPFSGRGGQQGEVS